MSDNIKPDHYRQGDIQPIDYARMHNLNFNLGNVLKYIIRHEKKGGVEDLKKAVYYLHHEISYLEGGSNEEILH